MSGKPTIVDLFAGVGGASTVLLHTNRKTEAHRG
jgi:hypothetical protein